MVARGVAKRSCVLTVVKLVMDTEVLTRLAGVCIVVFLGRLYLGEECLALWYV